MSELKNSNRYDILGDFQTLHCEQVLLSDKSSDLINFTKKCTPKSSFDSFEHLLSNT